MSIPLSTTQAKIRHAERPGHTFAQAPTPQPHTPGKYGNGEAYDRYMGRWSTLLARQFLEFVEIGTAQHVLDIGSGTGSLIGVIAASTKASRIVGIDPVPQFVQSARQRFGGPRVTFDYGDARELPFPDSEFDASLSLLSFHHIPDGKDAAYEMLRVTRAGGIVAACEWDCAWDSGPGMEMFRVLHETLLTVHPQSESQYSLRRQYGGRGELLGIWKACGIKDAKEIHLTVPLTFTDFDDFWIPFIEGPSSVVNCLSTLSPALKNGFQRKLRRALLGDRPNGPIELLARAWAVRGRVP
jgi:SAM-dependent methyltransferase